MIACPCDATLAWALMRISRYRLALPVSLLGVAGLLAGAAGLGGAAQATHAAKAPKEPPIVVRNFRFLGFDRDVVGRGWDARPNGERDAHFRFMVATPKGARRWPAKVWLRSCNPGNTVAAGQCRGPEGRTGGSRAFASSQPDRGVGSSGSAAVLAVFRNGKRLKYRENRLTWIRLPRSAKGVRFDVYANDGPGCIQPNGWSDEEAKQNPFLCYEHLVGGRRDQRFAPSQLFRVQLQEIAAPVSSRWLKLPGQAATPSTPPVSLGELGFHGLDQDVVGPTLGSPPDGVPDGHFSIELTSPTGPGYLMGVHLTRSAEPPDTLPWRWYSDGGSWSSGIAVFADSTRLKIENPDPVHCDPLMGCNSRPDVQNWVDLHWSTKPLRLDIYAGDQAPGVFKVGQRFKVGIYVWQPGWVRPVSFPSLAETGWLTLSGA